MFVGGESRHKLQLLMFTVDGRTVTTNILTEFKHGSCADVQNGTEVEVKGLRQPDGSVLASEVELDIEEVELEGSVSGLGGSCPVLTFTVDGRTVTTDSSTEFKDGTCGDVQDGVQVEVEGLLQPDGTVFASKVELDIEEVEEEEEEEEEVEVKLDGSVWGVGAPSPVVRSSSPSSRQFISGKI